MKPTTTCALSLSVCLFVLLFAASCKKDSTTSTPDPNALLCNGKGTSDYLPLDTGNVWKYDDGTVFKIGGPTSYQGGTYVTFDGYYVRQAANGDVITYDNDANGERIFIPAHPTVGQVLFQYSGNIFYGKVYVKSINDSINTSTCKYRDLLAIEMTTPSGNNLYTWYYKKGLGLVGKQVFGTRKLKSVTLK